MNEPYINNCLILHINHDDKDQEKLKFRTKQQHAVIILETPQFRTNYF